MVGVSIPLYPNFLRQGISPDLELTNCVKLGSQKDPSILLFLFLSTKITGMHHGAQLKR